MRGDHGVLGDFALSRIAQHWGISPERINPASIDLPIGDTIIVVRWDRTEVDAMIRMRDIGKNIYSEMQPTSIIEYDLKNFPDGFWLMPGEAALLHTKDTLKIPINTSGLLLLKSSRGREFWQHAFCLSGDTKIEVLRDRQEYPDGVPIKELVGKEFCVYSYDISQQRFTVAKATAKKTGVSEKLVEVQYKWFTPKSGWQTEQIKCTPHHKFLTLDNRWVEAKDLKPKDRLRPLWKPQVDAYGYVTVRPDPMKPNFRIKEHRFAMQELSQITLGPKDHVHHVSGNKQDNNPLNLEVLSQAFHLRYHSGGQKNPFYGKTHTPEQRLKWSRERVGNQHTEDVKQKMSISRIGDKNPKYRTDITFMDVFDSFMRHHNLQKVCEELKCSEELIRSRVKSRGFKTLRQAKKAWSAQENHEVVSVTELEHTEDVYDLYVPGHHNFVAQGVVVHNSGWFDPGFEGQGVLEVYAPVVPIQITKDMLVAQMILMETMQVEKPYGPERGSHYQHQRGNKLSAVKKEWQHLIHQHNPGAKTWDSLYVRSK